MHTHDQSCCSHDCLRYCKGCGKVYCCKCKAEWQSYVVLREISKEEAEKEILKLFSGGQVLYYSDIAEKLGLDLKLVVEICNELQSKGRIEVIDDALHSR